MSTTTPWSVSGVYFEACNCERVCPCYDGEAPTDGFCEGNCAWHVRRGAHGDVPLDGLSVVMAQHCPGHMSTTEWQCWFFVDDRASDGQFDALEGIFTGRAGGHIEDSFGDLWVTRGVERARIDVDLDGWRPRASIPERLGVAIGLLEPDAGPTLCYVPNTPGVSAVAEEDWFDGDDLQFDHGGANALATAFAYSSD